MIIKVEREINVHELVNISLLEEYIYEMVEDNLSDEDFDFVDKLDKIEDVITEAYIIIVDELTEMIKKGKEH